VNFPMWKWHAWPMRYAQKRSASAQNNANDFLRMSSEDFTEQMFRCYYALANLWGNIGEVWWKHRMSAKKTKNQTTIKLSALRMKQWQLSIKYWLQILRFFYETLSVIRTKFQQAATKPLTICLCSNFKRLSSPRTQPKTVLDSLATSTSY